MSRVKWLTVVALAALALPLTARARDVKRCGLTIGAGNTGTVVRDVKCGWHCTADPTVRCTGPTDARDAQCPLPGQGYLCSPDVITLERNATLDLNGFEVRAANGSPIVACAQQGTGKCTVVGPGTLQGSKSAPQIEPGNKTLVLRDLTLGRSYHAIESSGWIHATDVVLDGGLIAEKGMRVKNLTITVDSGVFSMKNLYANGVILGGPMGAEKTVRAKNVIGTTDIGGGIRGRHVVLRDVVLPFAMNPADCVEPRFTVAAERRLRMVRSSAAGLESGVKPILIDSSCRASKHAGDDTSWGVCSEDAQP